MKSDNCDHKWKWDKFGYAKCEKCNISRSKYHCVVCDTEFFQGICVVCWGQGINFCSWHCLEHFDGDSYRELEEKEEENNDDEKEKNN